MCSKTWSVEDANTHVCGLGRCAAMVALPGPRTSRGRRKTGSEPTGRSSARMSLCLNSAYVSPAQSRISSFRSKLRSKVGGPSWFSHFSTENYATIVSLFDLPPLRIGEVDLHRHDLSNNPSLSLSLSLALSHHHPLVSHSPSFVDVFVSVFPNDAVTLLSVAPKRKSGARNAPRCASSLVAATLGGGWGW